MNQEKVQDRNAFNNDIRVMMMKVHDRRTEKTDKNTDETTSGQGVVTYYGDIQRGVKTDGNTYDTTS